MRIVYICVYICDVSVARRADSCAVRHLGSLYRTCPGYMGPEHHKWCDLNPRAWKVLLSKQHYVTQGSSGVHKPEGFPRSAPYFNPGHPLKMLPCLSRSKVCGEERHFVFTCPALEHICYRHLV